MSRDGTGKAAGEACYHVPLFAAIGEISLPVEATIKYKCTRFYD
jgi:hypothetical protein